MWTSKIRAILPLWLFLFYSVYVFQKEPLAIAGSLVMFLLCALLKVVPETWWTPARYLVISFFLMALTIALRFWLGTQDAILLLPLIYVSATAPREFSRWSIFVAVCVMLTSVVISYEHKALLTLMLPLLALYYGVRRRFFRREAYQQSQRDLRELQQSHQELQEAAVHSMRYAAMEERIRLARDLHDGLGHRLTSLIIQLQTLEIMLPDDPQKASQALPAIMDNARHALSEVRLSVREWAEDESGLGLVAMRGLVSQTVATSRLQVEFQHEAPPLPKGETGEWSADTSVVLYRVLQESLTNIMRHAEATQVTVRVEEDREQVTLTIADNGCYKSGVPLNHGFGMQGIIERCRSLGGTCTFTPHLPNGLLVTARLPLQAD